MKHRVLFGTTNPSKIDIIMYFSEIDHRQRADAEWVKAIMQKNL